MGDRGRGRGGRGFGDRGGRGGGRGFGDRGRGGASRGGGRGGSRGGGRGGSVRAVHGGMTVGNAFTDTRTDWAQIKKDRRDGDRGGRGGGRGRMGDRGGRGFGGRGGDRGGRGGDRGGRGGGRGFGDRGRGRGGDRGGGFAPRMGRSDGDEQQGEGGDEARGRGRGGGIRHKFKTDFNDHFETQDSALKDVLPCVEALRGLLRPTCPENFTLYDPYFCTGRVAGQWRALGIDRVEHEDKDFYLDIAAGAVPEHDMLVTNPPFSEDHIERLFYFLLKQRRPFAVLFPDYTCSKPWFADMVAARFTPSPVAQRAKNAPPVKGQLNVAPKNAVVPLMPLALLGGAKKEEAEAEAEEDKEGKEEAEEESSSDAESDEGPPTDDEDYLAPCPPFPVEEEPEDYAAALVEGGKVGTEPFYVVPGQRYNYDHPQGVGKAESHFGSLWVVWCGSRTTEVVREAKAQAAAANTQRGGQETADGEEGGEAQRRLRVFTSLGELKRSGVVQDGTRKNPKQRVKTALRGRNL